jgi:hypothetical protein
MTPCDGTNSSAKWCCGDSSDCCALPDDSPNVHFLAATFGASTSPQASSTGSVATASIPSSTTATASASTSPPTSSNSNANNNDLSSGAKAGIGVGAAIGALILLGLGFFIAKSMQWKKKAKAAQGDGSLHNLKPMVPGHPIEPRPVWSTSVAELRVPLEELGPARPTVQYELPTTKNAGAQEIA